MGIHSINSHAEFTSYKITSIPSIQSDEVKNPNLQTDDNRFSVTEQNENIHEAPVAINKRQDAALEDISITFNKQDDFDFIGRDSDIDSLDMEKAISDMKKDEILQQYTFFVGNSNAPLVDNEDGLVFAKF